MICVIINTMAGKHLVLLMSQFLWQLSEIRVITEGYGEPH